MTKKILLVDDSTTILMGIGDILSRAGYAIEKAGDGVEALSKLKTGFKPDLIVTDINMPNMDGLTLIKEVRKLAGLRFTPILVLTTESQQGKRDEARASGATGWIVKPVGGQDLLKTIGHVLPLAA